MQTASVLRRCKEALPAVMGALIAAAAALVLAKSAASAKNAVKGAQVHLKRSRCRRESSFMEALQMTHATSSLHSIL